MGPRPACYTTAAPPGRRSRGGGRDARASRRRAPQDRPAGPAAHSGRSSMAEVEDEEPHRRGRGIEPGRIARIEKIFAYAYAVGSVYTGMDADSHAVLGTLVGSIPVDKLRFLTSDRRRAYAAILWTLLGHRRAHEIEVYYDELLLEAIAMVPAIEPGSYTPDTFRADVKQLEDWGNLAPRRLEPRRIETLADRSLQKFLCRLDADTAAILEFLEARSRGAAVALSDRGRHLLRDADERLAEALRLAHKIA